MNDFETPAAEPVEPAAPEAPVVEEDNTPPGEEPLPEEQFMGSEEAAADDEVDDGESHDRPNVNADANEGEKYDGGEIPPAPEGAGEPSPEPAPESPADSSSVED